MELTLVDDLHMDWFRLPCFWTEMEKILSSPGAQSEPAASDYSPKTILFTTEVYQLLLRFNSVCIFRILHKNVNKMLSSGNTFQWFFNRVFNQFSYQFTSTIDFKVKIHSYISTWSNRNKVYFVLLNLEKEIPDYCACLEDMSWLQALWVNRPLTLAEWFIYTEFVWIQNEYSNCSAFP